MKSIGFFNNKGGVGKTTLLCNVAASLALTQNLKILVIDADPQCNASAYLLPENTLANLLLDNLRYSLDSFYEPVRRGHGYPDVIPTIITSERFGVDLIVGDPKLSIREDLLATDWSDTLNGGPRGFQTTYVIKELISRLSVYDIVLVDMGPSLGALNRSVILAVDYFLMPLSVDIFSLMAVDNIIRSFKSWKTGLIDAIDRHEKHEGYQFEINGQPVKWNIDFIGYVMQQYRAKAREGVRQPVAAYDKIIDMQREALISMCSFFNQNIDDTNLGIIPTLSSVVPLSQQAHAPIFSLESKDGIVGSHYTRVLEAGAFFHTISENIKKRVLL
jgi:cellulose biosynthesis protein BcsQ